MKHRKEAAMFRTIASRKTVAAAVAALTLVTATAMTGTPAQAKGWKTGVAIGVGIGLLAGAAAAHAYHGPYYATHGYSCRPVARYDHWGNYIGTARVCGVSSYGVPYGW
jgi:hypothetical protein